MPRVGFVPHVSLRRRRSLLLWSLSLSHSQYPRLQLPLVVKAEGTGFEPAMPTSIPEPKSGPVHQTETLRDVGGVGHDGLQLIALPGTASPTAELLTRQEPSGCSRAASHLLRILITFPSSHAWILAPCLLGRYGIKVYPFHLSSPPGSLPGHGELSSIPTEGPPHPS